jgi:preprotein translocase subunit Sec61beta
MSNGSGKENRGPSWRDIKAFSLGIAFGILVFFAATQGKKLSPTDVLALLFAVVAMVLGFVSFLDARETKQLINEIRVRLAEMGVQLAILSRAPGSYEIPSGTLH